jgi:hypothetical protein
MGADMTESAGEQVLPPLVLDYDGNWVEVDLSADVGAWAEAEAPRILARDGDRASKRDTRRLADQLAAAASLAGRVQDSMVTLLLCPPPARRILTIVRLVAVELEDEDVSGGVETARRIVAPADLPSVEPPEVIDFPTAAGLAARSRSRVAGQPPERHVSEWLNYAWVIPGYRYGALLTTAFTDLVVAGQWRPALDKLAADVSLEGASP